MGLFNVLKNIAEKVQQRNHANPEVETADTSVFDNIKNAIEGLKNKHGDPVNPAPQKRVEAVEELKERVFEVQRQNAEDPNIPTAHDSVFEEFGDLLERYKGGEEVVEHIEYKEVTPMPSAATPAGDRMVAITNSMGGSLALRAQPDLGAAKNTVRIPDLSRVSEIGYSEHSINLDGQQSRWVHIEFDGQQGWVLENYLNFN